MGKSEQELLGAMCSATRALQTAASTKLAAARRTRVAIIASPRAPVRARVTLRLHRLFLQGASPGELRACLRIQARCHRTHGICRTVASSRTRTAGHYSHT